MHATRFIALAQSLLLTLGLLGAPLLPAQTASIEELNRIIAVVDEDVIVRSELDQAIAEITAQLRQQGQAMPPLRDIEPQILDRLIIKKLELAAAKRAGINVSEEQLAQTIGNIARNNQVTLSEFRAALEAEGISFRTFRESIREQITSQLLLEQEVLQQIRVTDQEVEAFLDRQGSQLSGRSEYRLAHILIATPDGATPEQRRAAQQKAERLIEQLRGGVEFAGLALTESDGRQALEGGDLGWRPSDQLPSLFADLGEEMERGAVSEPIASPSGYHIIKLVDFKGGERNIINQTEVRHILVRTDEVTSDDDARTRLEQLKKRIEGGDDFASLARSNSDDTGSAIQGGTLGWINPGDTLPRFEQEVEALEVDQLSEPFRTDFGWHLVQVTGRRQYDSTEEVRKAEARSAIRKRKFEEESTLYLRRLRDEAYVDIRLDDTL